jgi:hypothetical protein
MMTLKEQETKAFLAMAEKLKQLEEQLRMANERVAFLEAQVYGGPTK